MEIGRDARLKSEVAQLLNEKAQLQVGACRGSSPPRGTALATLGCDESFPAMAANIVRGCPLASVPVLQAP